MKNILSIVAFVIMFLVAPLHCFAETTSKPVVVNLSENVEKTTYVELCYPTIGGLRSQEVLNKINADIKEQAKSFVTRVEMLNSLPGAKITGWSNYVLRYSDKGILSITFNEGAYLPGAQYPQVNMLGLNYNTETGERLKNDIKQDIATLNKLNANIEAELKRSGIDSNHVGLLMRAPKEFFYNAQGEKRLIIQKYTIAPYEVGTIFIPAE